jgi:DNA-binding NtrC family response regulator/tetratricopeptide (TPR) repeat protein
MARERERVDAGDGPLPVDRLEGTAAAIQALRQQIRRLSVFDAVGGPMVPTCLLHGETGTGKGLVARIIHDSGPRAAGPFIPVNCAAIPETMLEAELFGFEAGAFTDAKRGKPGLFEAASGGTLFLDEVDSLPLALQGKLLTAIESKRVRRLGSVAEHAVDTKLIAACQGDLGRLAATGRFREDLFHRLAVVVLALPPLRERGDDIVALARAFLERLAQGYGAPRKTLSPDAEAWVRRYEWPGNVRELGHVMERVTLLHPTREVDAASLAHFAGPAAAPATSVAAAAAEGEPAAGNEADELRDALARTAGNVVAAARLLGLSRDTMRYRMRRFGITPPRIGVPPGRRPGSSARDADPAAAAVPASLRARAPGSAIDGEPAMADAIAPPSWEQKTIAVVAIELTWSETDAHGVHYEPWTEGARWERIIGEKLAGLGGVLLQRGPSLLLWAFGVPRAVEQVAQRAVHGALSVRQMTVGLGEGETAPRIRIAVHLGNVLVDAQAPEPGRHVLAVGDALALPVRLLGQAKEGDILVSTDVQRRVDTWVALEPRATSAPADVARKVEAYAVLGTTSWRDRVPATSRRLLARFVGRDGELAMLRNLLAATAAGSGQAVGVVGEPGTGKSRLLFEFRHSVDTDQVFYAEGHCVAYRSMTPYLPLLELLTNYLDLRDSDGPAEIARKVRDGVLRADVDPATDHTCLLHLLGVPPAPEDDPSGLGTDRLKERIFEVLRQMIVGVSQRRPFVLAIENAHWIDPTSAELFTSLVDRLAGTPCMLVMTYRPGYQPPWLGHSYATQIALRPLAPADSRRVVRAVAGSTALSEALENELLAKAEGNPFFLEELARSVVEQGGRSLMIPDTVQAVLGARIDRLSGADRHFLHTAAVIGKEVPFDLLQSVCRLPDDVLRERLDRLRAAEFLFETHAQGDRAYSFKHALTQAVAYDSLPAAARRQLHGKVVEALEASPAARRAAAVEQLAHHAARGEVWDKAVTYFRQAAALARERSAPHESATCFEQALAALANFPQDRQTAEQECELRFMLGHTLHGAGEFRRAMEAFRDAQVLAEKLGDDPRLAQILGGMAYVLGSDGAHAEAAQAGERALTLATALRDPAVEVWTSIGLARAYFAMGQHRRAIECCRRVERTLDGRPVGDRLGRPGSLLPAVAGPAWLALCLARVGEFDEAVAKAEEAVRIAESFTRPQERVWAGYCLGRALHARYDFDRAIAVLERIAALCESGGFPLYFSRVLSGLGSSLAQAGRLDEALPLLERARTEARSINLLYGLSLIVIQVGETCLAAGRVEDARRHAAEGLALCRARGERGDEGWALHLHAGIAAISGEDAEALDWYGRALAIAQELEMRPLAAHCHVGRGVLLGGTDEGRSELAQAVEAFAAMGNGPWEARSRALLDSTPLPGAASAHQ